MNTYARFFPYDKPRDVQKEGMKIVNRAMKNRGIVSMEGACGTGKTLTALVPSISYVFDDDTIPRRVFIVTSVKQQMAAFQDEIKQINNMTPDEVEKVTALTLVSVSDLHPYVEQGVIEYDDYSSIDKLREGTRILEEDYEYSFEDLYAEAERQSSSSDKYAYSKTVPELREIEYDPYYAKYRAEKEFYDKENKDIREMIPFNTNKYGLLTAPDLREICAKEGFCPHSIMRLSLEFVDVVIGNYNHIFDPKTVERVTYPLINDETITIFDEAHNLCARVRKFLSTNSSLESIIKAQVEIREISLIYKISQLSNSDAKRVVNEAAQDESSSLLNEKHQRLADELDTIVKENGTIINRYGDTLDAREDIKKVLDSTRVYPDKLDTYVSYLEDVQKFINKKVTEVNSLSEDTSIQLRDPSTPDYDDLTTWTELGMHSNNIMKDASKIGKVVHTARNKFTDSSVTKKTRANSVGKLLTKWHNKGHKRYYRSIEIEERYKLMLEPIEQWQNDYKAKLTLHNCIPRDEIADILDTFHGTTLMSATLEPIDIYNKTVGIDILEEEGRNVYNCQFGLSFPEKNRITLGVEASKFNYSNRGNPFNNFGKANLDTDTRKEYNDIVFDILSNTEGNSLVVMPNYKEAQWIGSLLKDSYECPVDNVFIDESSSNDITSKLKNDFFKSENSVLITAAGGTLIEGVDYIGERLNNVIICGVPITNTSSDYMKAVRAAYDAVFEGTGFNLAFTIPAVWKSRQAIGRVIRTDYDIGTRILIDKRYTDKSGWDSVQSYLSEDEQEELEVVDKDNISSKLNDFWS